MAENNDEIVCIEATREEAIQSCIALARADAREAEEPVTISCCCMPLGDACAAHQGGTVCPLCEHITVFPDGSIQREPRGA